MQQNVSALVAFVFVRSRGLPVRVRSERSVRKVRRRRPHVRDGALLLETDQPPAAHEHVGIEPAKYVTIMKSAIATHWKISVALENRLLVILYVLLKFLNFYTTGAHYRTKGITIL